MNCPGCYNQCRDGAKFCSKCGYRFDSPSSVPPTAPIQSIEIPYQQQYQETYQQPCQQQYQQPSAGYAMEPFRPQQVTVGQIELSDLKRKARNVVILFSTVAAGLTVMWLPFIDLFFILPLLCYMVVTVARIFGQKLTVDMAKELIITCFAGSMSFLGAYACGKFIPFIGGVLTAPLIFACTYGIGDVAIAYFSQEGKISRAQMRDIYSNSFQNSKKYYSGDLNEAKDSLENIKEYIDPQEYEKIKKRLG
ncbi:MAG: hypothetical protein ABRQ39_11080 [Candidatus Eremiobacterota bacterium]